MLKSLRLGSNVVMKIEAVYLIKDAELWGRAIGYYYNSLV